MSKRVKQKQIDKLLAEVKDVIEILKDHIQDAENLTYECRYFPSENIAFSELKKHNIVFSTWLANQYINFIRETIIHEIAHIIGPKDVNPKNWHGENWQNDHANLLHQYRLKTGRRIVLRGDYNYEFDVIKKVKKLWRER